MPIQRVVLRYKPQTQRLKGNNKWLLHYFPVLYHLSEGNIYFHHLFGLKKIRAGQRWHRLTNQIQFQINYLTQNVKGVNLWCKTLSHCTCAKVFLTHRPSFHSTKSVRGLELGCFFFYNNLIMRVKLFNLESLIGTKQLILILYFFNLFSTENECST